MSYIIGSPCVSTCDTACVAVCPVDCIHGPIDITGAGAEVAPNGRPLAVVHAADEAAFDAAAQAVRAAMEVSEDQPAPRPLELDVVR